jgi:hypothetical protein
MHNIVHLVLRQQDDVTNKLQHLIFLKYTTLLIVDYSVQLQQQ